MDRERAEGSAEDSAGAGRPAAERPGWRRRRRWRRHRHRALALAAGFLPGALLGALFALLLFFLNPELPFGPAAVSRAILIYGGSWGLVSLLLLAPAALLFPRRALRGLPWTLTGALALGTFLLWFHPSYYAFYLPTGINERMIKAAIWLTVATFVLFYTALLHAVSSRRYGIRSRLAYLLFSLASLAVAVERRAAYRPPPEPTPRPAAVEAEAPRPRLLVVGIEAATLDALLPLAEQGLLPFFSQLIDDGASGHLESIAPSRRAALWTTLATGRYPYQHGVVSSRIFPVPALGEGAQLKLVPAPARYRALLTLAGSRGRPVDARDRRVLAAWEILARLGVPTGLVGWPMSAPLPPELRFGVADRFFVDPELPGVAVPPEVAERGRLFRPAAADLPSERLAPFGGRPPEGMVAAMTADRWRVDLQRFLAEQEPDLGASFVMLPGLREVSRRYYGGYEAVQFAGKQRAPYLDAATVLRSYYVYLDGLLAQLWQARQGRTLMVVVSAHGAASASGLRWLRAELAEEKSLEGSFRQAPDGLLLLHGEGVRPGGRIGDAKLVDVLPTLLYGIGLPIPRDLDGQVLRQAFEVPFLARHPLAFVPTYEGLPRGEPADEGTDAQPR